MMRFPAGGGSQDSQACGNCAKSGSPAGPLRLQAPKAHYMVTNPIADRSPQGAAANCAFDLCGWVWTLYAIPTRLTTRRLRDRGRPSEVKLGSMWS